MNHPERRPLLVESLIQIPDESQVIAEILTKQLPEFFLRALDILGSKIIYALGYKTDGIYNFESIDGGYNPERRRVKHVFYLDDGTVVKVV